MSWCIPRYININQQAKNPIDYQSLTSAGEKAPYVQNIDPQVLETIAQSGQKLPSKPESGRKNMEKELKLLMKTEPITIITNIGRSEQLAQGISYEVSQDGVHWSVTYPTEKPIIVCVTPLSGGYRTPEVPDVHFDKETGVFVIKNPADYIHALNVAEPQKSHNLINGQLFKSVNIKPEEATSIAFAPFGENVVVQILAKRLGERTFW